MMGVGARNRVMENALDGNGIQVNPGQVGALIARNTILSAGDAIVVFEPSTILQANSAAVNAPNGAVQRSGLGPAV